MFQDMLGIVRLEMAIMRLVKINQNCHDLTDTQTSLPSPLHCTAGQQPVLPARQKHLAKVIDIAKQFE